MPTLRRLDRRRVTAAAAACATSSPPARCKRSARFSPVTHDQRPAHCARSLLSPPTPTAFDPDRIGSWKAASLRHQHRRGSNRPGGGGKPGRETDHNRPELELGRTLPPADGRVKRDGGEIFGAVGRREGEDGGRPRRSPQTGGSPAEREIGVHWIIGPRGRLGHREAPRWSGWRPLGARRHGDAEVIENVPDHGRLLADGADAHGPATTGAPGWIHLLHLANQTRPGLAAPPTRRGSSPHVTGVRRSAPSSSIVTVNRSPRQEPAGIRGSVPRLRPVPRSHRRLGDRGVHRPARSRRRAGSGGAEKTTGLPSTENGGGRRCAEPLHDPAMEGETSTGNPRQSTGNPPPREASLCGARRSSALWPSRCVGPTAEVMCRCGVIL